MQAVGGEKRIWPSYYNIKNYKIPTPWIPSTLQIQHKNRTKICPTLEISPIIPHPGILALTAKFPKLHVNPQITPVPKSEANPSQPNQHNLTQQDEIPEPKCETQILKYPKLHHEHHLQRVIVDGVVEVEIERHTK